MKPMIVDKKYEEHRDKVLAAKVASMKPAIDNQEPPHYSHLRTRSKAQTMKNRWDNYLTILINIERNAEIEAENARLVAVMKDIKMKPSRLDNNQKSPKKASLNAEYRKREQQRIQAENEVL
jgi:hypothetical protein